MSPTAVLARLMWNGPRYSNISLGIVDTGGTPYKLDCRLTDRGSQLGRLWLLECESYGRLLSFM